LNVSYGKNPRQLNHQRSLYWLTLANKEKDVEEKFKKHIKEDENKKFLMLTRERIYEYASVTADSSDKQVMLDYFKNKTIYKNRTLRKAFSVVGGPRSFYGGNLPAP
jgi:hypothetical protein